MKLLRPFTMELRRSQGALLVLLLSLVACDEGRRRGGGGGGNSPSLTRCDYNCDLLASCTVDLCNEDTHSTRFDVQYDGLKQRCLASCDEAAVRAEEAAHPGKVACVAASSCRAVFDTDECNTHGMYSCGECSCDTSAACTPGCSCDLNCVPSNSHPNAYAATSDTFGPSCGGSLHCHILDECLSEQTHQCEAGTGFYTADVSGFGVGCGSDLDGTPVYCYYGQDSCDNRSLRRCRRG